jgi:hypothetical protein
MAKDDAAIFWGLKPVALEELRDRPNLLVETARPQLLEYQLDTLANEHVHGDRGRALGDLIKPQRDSDEIAPRRGTLVGLSVEIYATCGPSTSAHI